MTAQFDRAARRRRRPELRHEAEPPGRRTSTSSSTSCPPAARRSPITTSSTTASKGSGAPATARSTRASQRSQIIRRYVLSLENNRGPVGASIGVLGRGFTPQDAVSFEARPRARSTPRPPRSASSSRPFRRGRNYRVTLNGSAGNSPIGTFRVDPTNVTVSPGALTPAPRRDPVPHLQPVDRGARPADSSSTSRPTCPRASSCPRSSSRPGSNTVTIPVQGGKPGNGSLVLKGYGTRPHGAGHGFGQVRVTQTGRWSLAAFDLAGRRRCAHLRQAAAGASAGDTRIWSSWV